MKISDIKSLSVPEIKVIRFSRFGDIRGYFTETFRRSDFANHPEMPFMKGVEFSQCNESFSLHGTVRGLHFQWNPYMGKLVRTLQGRMIDLALDIRKGSPTFGKIIAYDMPANTPSLRDTPLEKGNIANYSEWIWVPPGFAHGNFFTENTLIEYFCSGEYSPGCEAGISPLAKDIDWSLCNHELKGLFDNIARTTNLITDKDKNGFSLNAWVKDQRSDNFIYGRV